MYVVFILHIAVFTVAGNVKTSENIIEFHNLKFNKMTNLEKIESEILSLLDEYKQKLDRVETKTPQEFALSTSGIISKPNQIIIDLANKMDYAKGLYIIKHGNEDEPILDEIISTSLQSFVEKWNAIH